jgi:hypothetical protein
VPDKLDAVVPQLPAAAREAGQALQAQLLAKVGQHVKHSASSTFNLA